MRLSLALLSALLLVACGKDEGKLSRTPYAYNGNGGEWESHAVPGAPSQAKPVYTARARPSLEGAVNLVPTVYYVPKIDASAEAVSSCAKQSLGDGWEICLATFEDCIMQGSCFVGLASGWRYFMKARAERRLVEKRGLRCRFGAGAFGCLAPYGSVAADPAHHQPGDVIYVPELDGKNVPYLGRHDGFLVVHDKGGAIKGPHRFDFFAGHQGLRDPDNALSRWGFGDKSRGRLYVKLSREEGEAVKREKGIPR
jgi:hypothetical protein